MELNHVGSIESLVQNIKPEKGFIRSQVTALIEAVKIVTTESKELRKFVSRLKALLHLQLREKDNYRNSTVSAKVCKKDATVAES